MGIDPTPAFDCLPLFLRRQERLAPGWRHPVKQDCLLIAGSVAQTPALVEAAAAAAEWAAAEGMTVQVLIGANGYPAVDDGQFANSLLRRVPASATLRIAHSETEWLTAIAEARLLVSGRFHHSIAAAFLHTPFLLCDSNTSKTDGLLRRLQLDPGQTRVEQPEQLLGRCRALLASPQVALVAAEVRHGLMQLAGDNFLRLPPVSSPAPDDQAALAGTDPGAAR